MMYNNPYIRFLYLSAFFLLSMRGTAQTLSNTPALLEPSGMQYFQNQYLANPATAGIDTGLHVTAAYRSQWKGIDGAPVTKFMSADGNIMNRVGTGIRVFNDVAGLLTRTRIALSYAYHLPLNGKGKQLSLGLSLALQMQRLNLKELNGDASDPSIGAFNRRDDYFEGEFGAAYTDGRWSIQGTIPNIRGLLKGDHNTVDGGNVFFAATSYRFTPADAAITSVEPKICFRGVRGYDNIVDIGVKMALLHNVAHVMAMYHTSKSITAGLGVNIKETLDISLLYTAQTGGIGTHVNGAFEVGATLHLFR
ncbi:PorP/SprF family type IX secretion system membrane protein [Chitinophaga nivalis]|uniref:PorP/SprF family type IX secretion system membrane protein n=1 Tax=Chitinophaga nivalis TaxID=2991709 RepID=A0ABT3IV15_9BACT|nr:PorP/SprF family type IX secretion system membrane protein [Chitinophaga nivalis]MCW3462509.1 PorP/SprF family type IX secretion system membrane protein [Chitinophaga nivalis]MCW3487800.1 PorP/SprF family type IX secretion system membrane protein [Chitinophaga nivalis]